MTNNPSPIKDIELLKYQALLKNVNKFIRLHQKMTYIQFDYYVVHDLALFSISHDSGLKIIERQVEEIIRSLGAIINIFNNPTIVLKDNAEVLPVEKAKIVNQNTLLHLANHSHLLSTVTDDGVKPKKLLTRVYEDDYGLYENLIFCNLIDEIADRVRKSRNYLSSLLYADRLMECNLLEQVNHRFFFLALGKLHTGYIRDHSQNLGLVHKLLDQTQLILQTISPLLAKPIYQKNLKRDKYLALKRTNIFLMQKDYRRIYKTFRFLQQNDELEAEADIKINHPELRRNYLRYALILTIFTLGHFNFVSDTEANIELKSLQLEMKYKDWSVRIENTKQHEIILRFNKDKPFNIMLVDVQDSPEKVNKLRRKHQINEVVSISQLYEPYLSRENVYISIEDIDSFRRLQQIVLKGMIQADETHRICPFCGGQLVNDAAHNLYTCRTCSTEIAKDFCPQKQKDYYYTDCPSLREQYLGVDSDKNEEDWTYQKQIESLLYYRNITKIDEKGHIICPHCQQVHHH